MNDLKITIDLSEKACAVLDRLATALDDLCTQLLCREGNFKEFTEAGKKQKETVKKAEEPTGQEAKTVDYEKLRAEIRTIASSKKVAGKDVKAVLKSFGGKLSEVANDKLNALKDEMAAL